MGASNIKINQRFASVRTSLKKTGYRLVPLRMILPWLSSAWQHRLYACKKDSFNCPLRNLLYNKNQLFIGDEVSLVKIREDYLYSPGNNRFRKLVSLKSTFWRDIHT